MLLILMYHQIVDPKLDTEISINKFQQHLTYLQKNFNIIIPGQTIFKDKISVCLTFDDAYADFYCHIFPLLKKLNIPAVLAIPSGLIEDHTSVDQKARLAISYPDALNDAKASNSPLCTWEEIRAMIGSGLIQPASHSLTHKNLAKINFNEIYQELCVSKRIISLKLENITEIFVYPFGAHNRNTQDMANSHYKYVMRIGNASNCNWNQKILYRIDADHFWKHDKKISVANLILWKIKYYFNKIRGK